MQTFVEDAKISCNRNRIEVHATEVKSHDKEIKMMCELKWMHLYGFYVLFSTKHWTVLLFLDFFSQIQYLFFYLHMLCLVRLGMSVTKNKKYTYYNIIGILKYYSILCYIRITRYYQWMLCRKFRILSAKTPS